MERLDKLLVDLEMASTRSQAQLLIKEGHVSVDGKIVTKPSFKTQSQAISVTKEELFVGRGAHKIEGALKEFQVDVSEKIIADVGASTGGFTDFVLNRGAKRVYAIDVGHGQLAKSLCDDSRVINLEGTNIRDLECLDELVDIAVVDLSFISLKLVLKNILNLVKDDGIVIALVKPQFEVGKDNLGKGGIVKNLTIASDTICHLLEWCSENSLYIRDFTSSKIKGKTGNQEYFFFFDKSMNKSILDQNKIRKIIGE